jgi:predicted CXXCH cytochrome family protein
MSFLLERQAAGGKEITRVEASRLLIGRGAGAQLRLEGAAVALEHARLEVEGEAFTLTDLGSVTGTYVNGQRITTTRLVSGDVVEMGGRRIEVEGGGEGGELLLRLVEEISPAAPQAAAPAERAPTVDYAAAYDLRQGVLNKAALALGLTAATALVLLVLTVAGRTAIFQPGDLQAEHASRIGTLACATCHRPFSGAADSGCSASGCHETVAIHQPAQVVTPPCVSCHSEHRGRDARITDAPQSLCVSCHGALELAPGTRATFAASVPSFEEHPEISLSLGPPEGRRRVPLSESREADPSSLTFSHQGHLKPGLVSPRGRVTLTCADCHALAPGQGEHMLPLSFELHCRDCHQLEYDLRRPGEVALHGEPSAVFNDLLGAYSGGDAWRQLSLEERRERILRGERRGEDLAQGVLTAAAQAEVLLYRNACVKCHQVDLEARPRPVVAATGIPADWLAYSRFPHSRHETGMACADCHAAAESTRREDVLLPDLESCRRCHGSGSRENGTAKVETPCAGCHLYHSPGEGEPVSPLSKRG